MEKMDLNWSFFLWILLPAFASILIIWPKIFAPGAKRLLPPGPPGWPVFGHMFKLGNEPHKTIAALKDRYGPVVWLRIGSNNTMAILTAKAAAEFFKNHDLSFGDRSVVETMRSHDYHKSSLALSPYGGYWRMLRPLCSMELFVQRKLNETVSIRRKCVDDLLSWIREEANDGVKERKQIQVARFVFLAAFNMVGNMMLSRDLVAPESIMAAEFFTAVSGILERVGSPNVSDLFSWLKWLDLQGLRRNIDRDMRKALGIASTFVKERIEELKEEGQEKTRKDFLDVLLEFRGNGKDEPDKLSHHDISIFILEIFVGGAETTSSSVEWALSELLCHPEEMIKTKAEIDMIVGQNKKFEESDIDNLPYLQAVVKETLRLHPPVPFLIPRKALHDTHFIGYQIPKDTQVFINAWAIGRDPECWDDPMSFKPERFIGSRTDYRGQHFQMLPFGAGRRMCVGLPLAHRMLHLVLGAMLHEFDWELEDSTINRTLDMREKIGITMRKLEPLKVIPKPRYET